MLFFLWYSTILVKSDGIIFHWKYTHRDWTLFRINSAGIVDQSTLYARVILDCHSKSDGVNSKWAAVYVGDRPFLDDNRGLANPYGKHELLSARLSNTSRVGRLACTRLFLKSCTRQPANTTLCCFTLNYKK